MVDIPVQVLSSMGVLSIYYYGQGSVIFKHDVCPEMVLTHLAVHLPL